MRAPSNPQAASAGFELRRPPPAAALDEDLPLTWGDPIMAPVVEAVAKTAAAGVPVTIVGEIGCGKNAVARAIHRGGLHAEGPYVRFNCRQPGNRESCAELGDRLEAARGGTLALDGIDELAPRLQAGLASGLDELDRGPEVPRLIATSRVEPRELRRSKALRQELWLALAVVVIRVPPLRRRRQDLRPLAQQLLDRAARRWRTSRIELTDPAASVLLAAPWPGNVRELTNALERSMTLAENGRLRPEHLRLDGPDRPGGHRTLAEIEREAIVAALADVGGHRRKAAARLGIGLRTLYDKIKRYRIR